MLSIKISSPINNLCDYTYDFCWNDPKIKPFNYIPDQNSTKYTYENLISSLKAGEDIQIIGNVGSRLAQGMGVNLKHLGGTGNIEKAGRIFVDGDIGPEAGMGAVGGTIYVKGEVTPPFGNIVEVNSDVTEYRKFRTITDILLNGLDNDELIVNSFENSKLKLVDGILRGTIGSRSDSDGIIEVNGDVHNGTGLLMQHGTIIVNGNAGMNTGSHLNGATIIIRGKTEEFAGAYMKKGKLIFLDAKGHVGAGIKGGSIFSKKRVNFSPSATKVSLEKEDLGFIRSSMDAGKIEALLYNKYERDIEKEKYVKVQMRDGSIVMRKIRD